MIEKNKCDGCEKGLVWVVEKVIEGNEAELKKLGLCPFCRAILIKTVNKAFERR